jgi:hypothetical protein
MVRALLASAAALVLGTVAMTPNAAQAQRHWQPELQRQHALCDQGYRPACIRFGEILGANQNRHAEWRRAHPNWWWWQPYVGR